MTVGIGFRPHQGDEVEAALSNKEQAASRHAFVERHPQSGLVQSFHDDLNRLVLGILSTSWTVLRDSAARLRAAAIFEGHKRPARFMVRMEPTVRWGLPTPACDAYAPALVLDAGDTACAFAIITGANEEQVREALIWALREIKGSQMTGT